EMSSSTVDRKRAARRVLFPLQSQPSPNQPADTLFRIQPVLLPRKRKTATQSDPAPAENQVAASAAPAAASVESCSPQAPPTTSQQQQAPPPAAAVQQPLPLPSFSTSFTSLLYNPAPASFHPVPASVYNPVPLPPIMAPLFIQTDFAAPVPVQYPVPGYHPMAGYHYPQYVPILCTAEPTAYPLSSSCFYTPEPYGPNLAKRACY
ncbi:hypothetical protein PFISCL1PPCAC_3600, partial [Pristionchus fissidentatus]